MLAGAVHGSSMNARQSQLSFATAPGLACFRVTGKPSLDLSGHLRQAAEKLIAAGHSLLLVDLADCPSVDSTFVGVLIFLTKAVQKATPPGRVCLMQAGDLVRHQLDSLGVLDRFDLAERKSGELRFADVSLTPASKAQNTWLCLTAHRDLIEAHAANAAKFKDVVEFLEADLRRQAPPDAS